MSITIYFIYNLLNLALLNTSKQEWVIFLEMCCIGIDGRQVQNLLYFKYEYDCEAEVKLRPTVSSAIYFGVGLPSGVHINPQVYTSIYIYEYIYIPISDTCGFLAVGHLLRRKVKSVIYSYNCFWALPEQSLPHPSPAELTTIFYCLTWGSCDLDPGSTYLYPLGT
jgi:hypothetical protein